ncbi:MAG: peptide ABC transporter substrate-binding protein [Myxococcaceae bacterium]|nr:peptide ABC transporter substrate-binding protein [Myxococcaceae bacterium]
MRRAPLALALLASAALAASRPRAGGTLSVVVTGPLPPADPVELTTASDAALLPLFAAPLCRLEGERTVGVLVRSTSWVSPTALRLEVRPGSRTASGELLNASKVAAMLTRARRTASPYRGLLWALDTVTVTENVVQLNLKASAPELESALCHPALAVPAATPTAVGPFVRGSAPHLWLANLGFPAGRPWADALSLTQADARTAERAVGQRRAQVALGVPAPQLGALLRATYLRFTPRAVEPSFRAAVESVLDREELARFFLKGPAAPLVGLVPGVPAPPASTAPAPLHPPRTVTLAFDQADEDHRAIATRLQVKLDALGYRVKPLPLPRSELLQRWSDGTLELSLHGVWLPPSTPAALAVAVELATRGSTPTPLASPAVRDEHAGAFAATLAPQLDLLPLAVQGLSLKTAAGLAAPPRDATGLPRLDDLPLGND